MNEEKKKRFAALAAMVMRVGKIDKKISTSILHSILHRECNDEKHRIISHDGQQIVREQVVLFWDECAVENMFFIKKIGRKSLLFFDKVLEGNFVVRIDNEVCIFKLFWIARGINSNAKHAGVFSCLESVSRVFDSDTF